MTTSVIKPKSLFDVRKNARGRPALKLTPLRAEVLAQLSRSFAKREQLTLAELARRCRLYDYRDARRVIRDLKAMGLAA